jgi:hypothetical protein
MKMFKDIIEEMKKKSIVFGEGLRQQDFDKIVKLYNLKFPDELRELYSISLPISKGFYNWKDYSTENINSIKSAICRPQNDLLELLEEIYWCKDWGEEPTNIDTRNKFIKESIKSAPPLIPIFTHRYLPIYDVNSSNPVFSIHGTDVIYYGNDLATYLQIEFGNEKNKIHDYSNVQAVPFWSDLL